ncbi:MAG TPA: cytochrome P450 [Polyangium sp.]|nr:cytochrome P450 [Polyangium sp.]
MGPFRSTRETHLNKVPLVPGALPLLGHTLAYDRDPLGFMEFAASWGPVVRVRLGPLEAVVLREPTDIERLLMGEHKRLTKDKTTLVLRRILGDGLLTSGGETWIRHRKLIAPIFQPASVARLGATMLEVTEQHTRKIVCGVPRELHADMTKLTADIVTRTLFASDLGSEADKVGLAIQALVDHYGHGLISIYPAFEKLPLPSNKRGRAALDSLDGILMRIVRQARERQASGTDLLSMLLDARDDVGTGLGDQEVRDHLMTFFLAGHETTALALTFTFTLLAKNPIVEERLRGEMRSVLGDKPVSPADLPRLPYARAVLLESMRLYPPAWAIGREALEDLSIAGYALPKGSQLWLLQWVNHRDARYFPEPLEFRPDRWLDGLERTLPRFAYYPFGGGARICIGNTFAMMEGILALVTLLRHFRIRLVNSDKPIRTLASITLRPKDPIPVIYEQLDPRTGTP